jgi:hypothetical protein
MSKPLHPHVESSSNVQRGNRNFLLKVSCQWLGVGAEDQKGTAEIERPRENGQQQEQL